MSKKFKRAAKALAGIGAAYLGSKMLGSKMEQMKRAKGFGTSMDTDTEFKGKVSNLTKKGMRREMEDSKIMPKAKPSNIGSRMPRSKNRFLGMNFGVSETPSNLEGFKEAERQRRIKTGFGRNVGRRSTATDAFDITGAKTGKFVTTKCKLGRNKKTKIT